MAAEVTATLADHAADQLLEMELLLDDVLMPVSDPEVVGSTLPRKWVRPAVPPGPSACPCGTNCGLNQGNSLGFAVIAFAQFIGWKLMPWQAFILIHGMELRPDGLPRFRLLLMIVSRQSGKTTLCALLAAFWLFIEEVPLVWGISAKLATAKEAWERCVKLVRANDDLRAMLRAVQTKNGDETLFLLNESQYKISAANDDAARGFTLHRLIMDELRRQRSWSAYSAAYSAMRAIKDAQCWAISNAGVADSLVLNTLREQAIAQIENEVMEDPIGLFEWSAVEMGPDGGNDVDLQDREVWKAAMPSLGYTITERTVLADMRTDPAPVFLSESLCIPVQSLDEWRVRFVGRWNAALDSASVPVGDISIGVDVSLDRLDAAIGICGAREDGAMHLEDLDERFEGGLSNPGLLPRLIELATKHKAPVVIDGYGPASPLIVDLERAGVTVIQASGSEIKAACQAISDAVFASPQTLRVRARPPLADAVMNVERYWTTDQWRWKRSDESGVSIAPLYAVTLAYLHRWGKYKPKKKVSVWEI